MPEWNDTAFILSARPHGETSVIVNIITAEHGRQAGLVRGGQSSKMRGLLQPGNQVEVAWRARLEEHLGAMQLELISANASSVLDDKLRLAGLSSVCAVMEACLPEREPATPVYNATSALLQMITDEGLPSDGDKNLDDSWIGGYVRWEMGMLSIAGYALGLDRCGISGKTEGLAYVSPRTGVAVTKANAGIHAPRLLLLPRFLGGISQKPFEEDLLDGMELTGYFLEKQVFGLHHKPLPPVRERFAHLARKRLMPEASVLETELTIIN
ncbi:MAG: DNA repair protein RecO [Candidatus Puniceispirillales bacterium WSBS_2018_MAG_OTU23]